MGSEPVALLPCPHCGGPATGAHKSGSAWFIEVDHTEACFLADFMRSEAEAVVAWNRRTPPASEPIPEVAEKLRMRIAGRHLKAKLTRTDRADNDLDAQAAALLSAQAVMLEEARKALTHMGFIPFAYGVDS